MALLFSMIASFFTLIADALSAINCHGLPFKVAYLRLRHIRDGHPFSEENEIVDTLRSEKPPHTNTEYIYTVHLVKCKCGLIYQSCGLDLSKK